MSNGSTSEDRTLLVPIANEETATRQLDTAIEIATQRSYRIMLTYVLDVPSQLSLEDGRRYLLEEGVEPLLDDAAARVESEGIPADRRIRIARGVATGIVGAIEKYDIDLTVAGSKNRSGEYRRLLGSVAERVVNMSERPVTIVKTPVDD